MKQQYHTAEGDFRDWANLHDWCLLETSPYDNGDYKLYYVTPNGQDVTVYVNKSGSVNNVVTNTHTYGD